MKVPLVSDESGQVTVFTKWLTSLTSVNASHNGSHSVTSSESENQLI